MLTFPIPKNTFCDVINQQMSRDTYKDFHLIRKVKQLLTQTGTVGKSYFNHRKRKVSKISAGGRLRKNNQALSYLRLGLKRLRNPSCRDRADHDLGTFGGVLLGNLGGGVRPTAGNPYLFQTKIISIPYSQT